jgi:anaphase-promoting complex subunit 7
LIDRLVVLSEQYPRDEVFTKLADVYTLNKQFADAMTQYHRSLSVNPASVDALRGLDRLEKLMRGEDPDEMMNSTMEHMDEQEDSMEAGEYIAS